LVNSNIDVEKKGITIEEKSGIILHDFTKEQQAKASVPDTEKISQFVNPILLDQKNIKDTDFQLKTPSANPADTPSNKPLDQIHPPIHQVCVFLFVLFLIKS
jgi:hypothetical protein